MPFQDPEIAAQNRKNQRYYKVVSPASTLLKFYGALIQHDDAARRVEFQGH